MLAPGHSENGYIALVAFLFASVGIWAGLQWNRKNTRKDSPTLASLPKEEVLAQLGITPREMDVLEQMAQGKSNQEIADTLFVSVNTVKTHLSNVFSKLGAQRRTQAIQKAKELGLLA